MVYKSTQSPNQLGTIMTATMRMDRNALRASLNMMNA